MFIVTYHAIATPASPVCCPPHQLEKNLSQLGEAGFAFVSLDDCADWLAGKKQLPARSVVITFDDGYLNVVTDGLPILEKLRVPATMFVIGSRIGGDNRWPGQWPSIPAMPLADASQLRALVDGGVSIGSHTWSHPALPELDDQRLKFEIDESADRLQDLLQTPVDHFAYPYGFRGAREIAGTRRRYRTAVNSEVSTIRAGADAHDLPRLDCHDLLLAARLRCLDSPMLGAYLAVRRTLRRGRRVMERFAPQ